MIIPIRCFTCNKIIGNKWEPYQKFLKEGLTEEESLNKLGLNRYCCRRMILAHVDLSNKLIKYT
jgi:DNA-directed RNA polymerase I, II, and III subunit RPABC5